MRTAKDRDKILGKALVRAFQEECEMEHPELEELAALIDGKLSQDERTSILEHLASCERCYEVFNMSSDMVKELQAASQPARFRMPLAFAAVLLIAFGAFLAYKNLQLPPAELVALKVPPRNEALRVLAPAELKEPSASLTTSVAADKKEKTKLQENKQKEKPAPVYYAKIGVSDAVGEFLNDTPDDVVTDKKQICELVAMLVADNKAIGGYAISEVRLERGGTLMRSARSSAGKAEIRIKNGVLTIRLVD